MSSEAIRKDYTDQLTQLLQEDLNRRMNVAATVFDTCELALIMVDLSSSMLLGALTFVATHAKDDADPAKLVADVEQGIALRLVDNREKVLRTAAAIRRGERPEQGI